jgi:AbrB family looped-hinge helix DNA binding protein
MIVELRKKSQITIPKSIVDKLGIQEGEKLQIFEHQGSIHMIPVAVYPKKYVENLQREIHTIKNKIKEGKQPVFDNVEDMFKDLDAAK